MSFKELQNELIKNKLVEIDETNFFNDAEIKLTDKSIKILEESGIKLFSNKKKKDNIINPEKISFKELFFNEKENKQLSMLNELLNDKKLKEVQTRLQNKNLPIVQMFHKQKIPYKILF